MIGWPPEPDGIEARDRTRKQWWVECRSYAKGTAAAFSCVGLGLLTILVFVLAAFVEEFSAVSAVGLVLVALAAVVSVFACVLRLAGDMPGRPMHVPVHRYTATGIPVYR